MRSIYRIEARTEETSYFVECIGTDEIETMSIEWLKTWSSRSSQFVMYKSRQTKNYLQLHNYPR